MAKVTDFKKLKQRQARRRAFKLAGLAGVILAIAYLLSSLVNSPEFAGLSSLGDMIKGGPGYPIDAPGGKIKGMYQNDSGIILLNETTLYIYNTSGSEVYSNLHRMDDTSSRCATTLRAIFPNRMSWQNFCAKNWVSTLVKQHRTGCSVCNICHV